MTMPVIKIKTEIKAPVELVFDLARCIDLHAETMSRHNEKAIAGVTKGLIKLGESVTWEATHFGVRQKLTSKITEYKRPEHFRDIMIKGIFKRFTHDHFFEEGGAGAVMRDVFDYDSPLWIFGQIADTVFLKRYLTKMLEERNCLIKSVAEGKDWKRFINNFNY